MRKFILLLIVLSILSACTAEQIKTNERAGIAWVRSAAITAHGALTAIRANAVTIEEGLDLAKGAFPPGSDLSKLDDAARADVVLIQTSTDQQLAEQAAARLIAKFK